MFEYIAIVTLILVAFLVFQKYIARSLYGRWKSVGDSLGSGRVYDPNLTIECGFDSQYTNRWYNAVCFDEDCQDECLKIPNASLCTSCIKDCFIPKCDD